MRSAKDFTSLRGSKFFFTQSSQNGEPVSGEKCHAMVSRTLASSWVWACSEVSFCMGFKLVLSRFCLRLGRTAARPYHVGRDALPRPTSFFIGLLFRFGQE